MNEEMEGARFESIVHYVMKNMRITYSRAGFLVMEVLKAGVALRRIKRTPQGTYFLAADKSGPIVHKIREPRFSDHSSDEISSEDSF
ncbi:uncharacterized protein LOC143342829 [Colletes latitarsis]|uniref:uncharacterized protein LOC143342829 n=1 Tax=Colletes latitarsis TaxID=2605962 RepID=UPI0040367193